MAHKKTGTERSKKVIGLTSVYGHELYSLAYEVSRQRQGLEDRWYRDVQQYYGIYSDEISKRLNQDDNRSKLFVNQTRAKVRILVARLIDTLLPQDEANWDIEATPVPRIQKALAEISATKDERPLQNMETEKALQDKELADKAATNMRKHMDDQLIDSGYYDICRRVIQQGVRLGCGVTKGPFASEMMKRKWKKKKKVWSMEATKTDQMRPKFAWCDLWNFYPDMDAESMQDCEYTFQLHRMSRNEIRKHGKNGDFDKDTVKYLLGQGPSFAPTDPGDFNQNLRFIRLLENEQESTVQARYLVLEYTGPLPAAEFETLCKNFDRTDLLDTFQNHKDPLETMMGTIWTCQDKVLRFSISQFESDDLTYSVFSLDPTESSVIGSHGIPSMLRDSQSSMNSAWRGSYDSAGLAGLPMYVVDKTRIEPVPGEAWEIKPGKIWQSNTGFSPQDGGDPIRVIPISGDPSHFIQLIGLSKQFMDEETNLNQLAQGDPGTSARQTAHGLTLLANSVNVLFRDSARSFDADITIPNMKSLYNWNMQFSDNDSVKGDMQCKARGSSVLMINEIVSQNMLMLINLVAANPESFYFLKFEEMIRTWLRTLRLDKYGIMLSDEEIDKLKEDQKNAPPPVDPMMEGKKELAGMDHQFKMEQFGVQRDIKIMELSLKEELTLEQIAANLEKVNIQTTAKHREFLAEVAVKEKHGEGI